MWVLQGVGVGVRVGVGVGGEGVVPNEWGNYWLHECMDARKGTGYGCGW